MKRFPIYYLTCVMILLILPIFLTFIYSIATTWHATILPEGLTFKWYITILTDSQFLEALGRTIVVSGAATLLSLIIMVPTVYIVLMHFPKLEKLLQIFVLMPYAIPGVIAAVGLIQIYSNGPIQIAGTIWVLLGVYIVVVLPFMYQGIRSSFRNIHAIELVQAAETLGVNRVKSFFYVIIPNIMPGVMVSALLSFSVLFGEFVLAKLLVGGSFETVQVYLGQMIRKSGHGSSAVVVLYFVTVLLLSLLALRISKKNEA